MRASTARRSLGLPVSVIAVVALALGACAAPQSREAAPEEPSGAASASAGPSSPASPVASPIAEPSSSASPSASADAMVGSGLRRSTRVCIVNYDEVGAWRNWISWDRYDTKDSGNPVFGEKACAEGAFTFGSDVKGSVHLSTKDRSQYLAVAFTGTNYIDDEPEVSLDGPGVSSDESYSEGESRTLFTQSPGNPRRKLLVQRLPDTDWIEFQITVLSPHQCRETGPCEVGDIGPGGGIVVYDAGTQKQWGRYLEVAPVGWAGGATDPTGPWCPQGSAGYGTDLGTSRDLGAGSANTEAIIAACGADTAAGKAAAYRGGGKSDWFLPSMGDLFVVWQQRSSNPVMMIESQNYWTSSQAETDIGEAVKMAIEMSNADWDETPFFRADQVRQRYVRPMRAF